MTWVLSHFHKSRFFFYQNCCLLIFSKDFWLRIKMYKKMPKQQFICIEKAKQFYEKTITKRQYLQDSWKQDSSQKKSFSIWITYTVTKMLIQEIQCCNWSFARLTFITGPLMTTSIAPFSSFVSVTSVVELKGAE